MTREIMTPARARVLKRICIEIVSPDTHHYCYIKPQVQALLELGYIELRLRTQNRGEFFAPTVKGYWFYRGLCWAKDHGR